MKVLEIKGETERKVELCRDPQRSVLSSFQSAACRGCGVTLSSAFLLCPQCPVCTMAVSYLPFGTSALYRRKGPRTIVWLCEPWASQHSCSALCWTVCAHLPGPVHTSRSQPCKVGCIYGILPNRLCVLPTALGGFLVVWPYFKPLMSF